jgi:menaquinone-dependent protoporphyrinogen oxidase
MELTMTKVLIVYATTDGHTRKICERLQQVIEAQGSAVDLLQVDQPQPDLTHYDKIVIGASIRYGKHSKLIYKFIEQNRLLLDSKPNAFFSVNVVARKPEKNQPDTNPYLKKFLTQIDWQPKQLAVFGGNLDYPNCGYLDRQMIRLIMWMTKGPTAPDTVVDYTDWEQVEIFGRLISDMQDD